MTFDIRGGGAGGGGPGGIVSFSTYDGGDGSAAGYSQVYYSPNSGLLNVIGYGGDGGGGLKFNGSAWVSSGDGSPGSASGGDTNIPGGGAAGGARGHMVVISSGNTLYAGNGGYGGRAVRTVSRGLILPGQALVIIVGSGAGAGAAGSNDGQYISQSGASAGAAGAVYISWT
ncbi:MAG TPA: hypothetical protein PLX43_02335 [Nitrobacter sp.]|nr:hypothetical protein [Nitrobacter sp.]